MSHTLVTMMAYLLSVVWTIGVAKPLWWDLMKPIWQIASFDSHWRLGEQKIRITWEEIELINAYQQGLMKSICIFSIYTLQEWQNCDDEMIRLPTVHQGLFSPWALSSNWCVGPSPHINHSNPTIILTTQIISTTQIWITSTNTLVSLMKLIPGLLAKHLLGMYRVSQKRTNKTKS